MLSVSIHSPCTGRANILSSSVIPVRPYLATVPVGQQASKQLLSQWYVRSVRHAHSPFFVFLVLSAGTLLHHIDVGVVV